MRPAARRAAPVGDVPRCLRVPSAAVWGEPDAEDPLWRERLAHAADTWRSRASAAGASNSEVWHTLPANVGRFAREPEPARLAAMLVHVGADVDALATEARATYPGVFRSDFTPGSRGAASGWHLRELAARRGTFGQ